RVPSRLIVLPSTIRGSRDEKVEELILRFPTAPIYSIHREFDYELRRLNDVHTLRAIRLPVRQRPASPAPRVYVLCNGLNEVDRMGFYYRLAGLILKHDPAAIFFIR